MKTSGFISPALAALCVAVSLAQGYAGQHVVKLNAIDKRADGSVHLNGSSSLANRAYDVYASETTSQPLASWTHLGKGVINGHGRFDFTDTEASKHNTRYYRIVSKTGAASPNDEVSSLNVVGYYNVACPPGFSLIANQLSTSNNMLPDVIPSPPVGSGFQIYDPVQGFTAYTFDDIDRAWTPDATHTPLPVGGGGFFRNNTISNVTLTFVGEVRQGLLSNYCAAVYSIVSSMVPQQGTLTELAFPARPGDQVLEYDNLRGYSGYTFDDIDLVWTPGNPAGPTNKVGQAFMTRQLTGKAWIRNFVVN